MFNVFAQGVETLTNFGHVPSQLVDFLDPATLNPLASVSVGFCGGPAANSTIPIPAPAAVPALVRVPIPYVSDLILTWMNLSAWHPRQQQQAEALLPRASTNPSRQGGQQGSREEEASATHISWKEFNNHYYTFLTWLSSLSPREVSREQKFMALKHAYSWETRTAAPQEARKHASRLSPHKTHELLWLVVVLQSVAVYSVCAHRRASLSLSLSLSLSPPTSPRRRRTRIPSNWPLFSALTQNVSSFSDNMKWTKRLITILSLWNITTDAYDLFQKKATNMLKSNAMTGPASSLLPWNEKSLRDMGKTIVEIETDNAEYDGSRDQSVHQEAMETFVNSFPKSAYFEEKLPNNEEGGDVASVFVEKKLDAYNNLFVDQLLGHYFAMFGMELPPGDSRVKLSSPAVPVAGDRLEVSKPLYGKDRFVPMICTFDAFLTKACNFSEAMNLKRLKNRIVLPKTGALKLFVANSSFSTAVIALHQARICISKFGAPEAFSKLGMVKLFPLLSASGPSCGPRSGDTGANMTQSEKTLLLWASIILVYLPLLVASFVSPSSAKALKGAERKMCSTVIFEGFDRVWNDISGLIANEKPMLHQNIASGVLVLLSSWVLYDGICVHLQVETAQPPPSAEEEEEDGKAMETIIQKVMDNVFNGLQLKINVMNETCIHVLQRISSDIYGVFRSSLHSAGKLNRGW